MRYRTSFDGLEGLAKGFEKDLARAVTHGVRQATEALKADVREETAGAFSLSHRLPKAWRSSVFPRSGDSVDATGWVAVRNTAADIIQSAITATTIRARNAKWLAIPTRDAGRFGLKSGAGGMGTTTNSRGARERITPAGFERRTGMKLRFVPDGGRRAFLLADRAQLTRGIIAPYRGKGRGARLYGPSGQTFVAFILVRSVRTKKRMDLDAIADQAAGAAANLIVQSWRD